MNKQIGNVFNVPIRTSSRWERLLARLLGSKLEGRDGGTVAHCRVWRGRIYVLSIDKAIRIGAGDFRL